MSVSEGNGPNKTSEGGWGLCPVSMCQIPVHTAERVGYMTLCPSPPAVLVVTQY
jgi:hypothetical protein